MTRHAAYSFVAAAGCERLNITVHPINDKHASQYMSEIYFGVHGSSHMSVRISFTN